MEGAELGYRTVKVASRNVVPKHSVRGIRNGSSQTAQKMLTILQFWNEGCVIPVILWEADELTVAKIIVEGRAEADSDPRPCTDGDRPSAQPAGIEGDGHPGDCQEPGFGGIHGRTG